LFPHLLNKVSVLWPFHSKKRSHESFQPFTTNEEVPHELAPFTG
jgi:hypothetical protein